MTPQSTVGPAEKSVLQFQRVWVREAVFVDMDEELGAPIPTQDDIEIKLDVKLKFAADGLKSYVLLRAVLEPPTGKKLFARLAAAVEGAFTVADGNPQRLAEFSRLQAPVLLLPYLRATISDITSLSRFNAVVIPPLNMVQLVAAMAARAEAEQVSATKQSSA